MTHFAQLIEKNHNAQTRKRKVANTTMLSLTGVLTALALVPLVWIIAYVVIRGGKSINLDFFTQRPLPYGEAGGGIAPAIVGTLYILAIAALIGIPIGIGTAVYLSEYGQGRFATTVSFVVDLIAGLPSIVVGVFVWALLVKQVVGQYSALAGGVALSIIMIPIVTRTVEEILRLVPDSLREAALALGAPRWRMILQVVVPTARAGVITAIVLSLARAGGETAPLLLTALGNQFFSFNLLAPMAALPVQIYSYAVSPYDDWHSKAWAASLVLVLVIGLFSLIVRLTTRTQRMR